MNKIIDWIEKNMITSLLLAIVFGVMVIALTITNITANKLQAQKRAEQKKEIQILTIETKYENCINKAEWDYVNRWEQHCKDIGEKPNCRIALATANAYDKDLENSKNQCFDVYKLELGLVK